FGSDCPDTPVAADGDVLCLAGDLLPGLFLASEDVILPIDDPWHAPGIDSDAKCSPLDLVPVLAIPAKDREPPYHLLRSNGPDTAIGTGPDALGVAWEPLPVIGQGNRGSDCQQKRRGGDDRWFQGPPPGPQSVRVCPGAVSLVPSRRAGF